jgi:hypothetical protein
MGFAKMAGDVHLELFLHLTTFCAGRKFVLSIRHLRKALSVIGKRTELVLTHKMTKSTTYYICIALGLFDLFSLVRTYETGLRILNGIDSGSFILTINLLVIISLIPSAVLWITFRRMAPILYYFQFPFKLLTFVLTFGFLLKISKAPLDSWQYKTLILFIFALEILRLVFAIRTHRKYFSDIKTASL